MAGEDVDDPELMAALVLIKDRLETSTNPLDGAHMLAAVGCTVLGNLGFRPEEPAHVQVDIDEQAVITTITWPLPALLPPEPRNGC